MTPNQIAFVSVNVVFIFLYHIIKIDGCAAYPWIPAFAGMTKIFYPHKYLKNRELY